LASFNAEAEEGEAKSVSKGRLGEDEDEDSDGDMSVDLFAPVDGAENFEEEDIEDAGTGMIAGIYMIRTMLTIHNCTELFYRDFFDPPPRAPATKPKGKGKAKAPSALSPVKSGKVRFHEEVQVRNIKAKGKNRPLSTMYEEDDDDDDDEYGEQMSFEDFEAGMDGEGAEDDEDEDEFEYDSDEGEDEEPEEDGGRDTMARLKDDLFADEEELQTGSYHGHLGTYLSLTSLLHRSVKS
jgi:U3 small nucleolar RNA-associated protein MPP10